MEEIKLKEKLKYFIKKVNDGNFDSATFTDFFSTIRWVESRDSFIFELSNFVAHQKKDRGMIVDKLNSFPIISDFIEYTELNKTKNVDMSMFPKKVLEAIALLYDGRIKKYYKLVSDNYRFKRKGNDKKVKAILQRVFFLVSSEHYLIDQKEIIRDFYSSVNYLIGKYSLNNLEKLDEIKEDEIMICILSVLANSKIITKNRIVIQPNFKSNSDGNVELRYNNNTCRFLSAGVQYQNGASHSMLVTNFQFEGNDYNFKENASTLIRNSNNELEFI